MEHSTLSASQESYTTSRVLKALRLPLVVIIIGLGVLAVVVFAKPKPIPTPQDDNQALVTVEVLPARNESLRLGVTSQGTAMPKREIDIVAQVSGQIVSAETGYVEGGFFKQQQVLLSIDDRDYQVSLLNAKARLADAQRQLAEEQGRARQAQREWRDLGNKSANDLFVRKPQLSAARANVESAKADVTRAELNIERTKISLPFDGRIREIYADVGQYLTQGSPIAKVYDSSVVEVKLPLTEQQAGLIDLPLFPVDDIETEEGHGGGPSVVLKGKVAGHSVAWQGIIKRTDAFVDSHSRMYYAIVEVVKSSDSALPLLPGIFVSAHIEGKALDSVMKLPRAALYERDQVFSLGDDNKVQQADVKVLQKNESYVWIQSAIDDGAMIVLSKQSLLNVGLQVTPQLVSEVASRDFNKTPNNTIAKNKENLVQHAQKDKAAEGALP